MNGTVGHIRKPAAIFDIAIGFVLAKGKHKHAINRLVILSHIQLPALNILLQKIPLRITTDLLRGVSAADHKMTRLLIDFFNLIQIRRFCQADILFSHNLTSFLSIIVYSAIFTSLLIM